MDPVGHFVILAAEKGRTTKLKLFLKETGCCRESNWNHKGNPVLCFWTPGGQGVLPSHTQLAELSFFQYPMNYSCWRPEVGLDDPVLQSEATPVSPWPSKCWGEVSSDKTESAKHHGKAGMMFCSPSRCGTGGTMSRQPLGSVCDIGQPDMVIT